MWRFIVLSIFFFVRIKESSATLTPYQDYLEWTSGSALNATIGPEDAVHCRLENNRHETVFDGFGPCRVVLDRVTMDHKGLWKIWFAVSGTVVIRSRYVSVSIAAPVDKPVVTSAISSYGSSVMLKCSVPEEHETISCTFRDPGGEAYIAGREVAKEGNNDIIRYESYAEDHGCTLRLMMPASERPGIWRCAVNTTRATSYNFFRVTASTLDPGANNYNTRLELKPSYTGGSATEGNAITLSCSIDAAVRYCYYRTPNGTVLNVDPSTSSADYEYVGNGFDAGECGIRIKNVPLSGHGVWSCNVGLVDGSDEHRDYINIYVNEKMMIYHRWQGTSVVVRLRIATGPKLEYCRFVRGDGVGFTTMNMPSYTYISDSDELYGACGLTVLFPTAEDLLPWTVIAKVIGEEGERSMTSTLEPRPHSSRGLSRTAAILLWSLFGTIFVFLIGTTLLSKKNRKWTSERVTRIRHSFRRQPQRQPNATELPQPNATQLPQPNATQLPQSYHHDILTDLPPKV